jgi:hypothetical protein
LEEIKKKENPKIEENETDMTELIAKIVGTKIKIEK